MDDLKLLPPPEKKVAAKVLIENGYSLRKAEEILGMDKDTVNRYAKQPTPDEMRQFEALFSNYIKENKQKGLRLVYQRILELIPKERKIDQIVKAGEFLEGKVNEAVGMFFKEGNKEIKIVVTRGE